MRARYLASLAEPQELYLERRVAHGSTWLLELNGISVGYAVVDDGKTLLELFYEDALAPEQVLKALTGAIGVKSGLFQSFDARMTMLAGIAATRIEPVGILFRRIWDTRHRPHSDLSMRLAAQADVSMIAAIDDGFFADDAEIRRYLDFGGLSVLEDAASRVVGCGIAEPVMPGGTDIDIGMLVAPDFRRRGFGAFIVSHLKSHILSQGLRPICGCAVDNVGSQKALQNAGFASDHKLLLFHC